MKVYHVQTGSPPRRKAERYNDRSPGRRDAGKLRVTSRTALGGSISRTGLAWRMQAENEIHT